MYLGAVPESVLPHVTRAVSDVERVVFPALLVELRKQAAWDIPAEVRVPRDSATPASAHLSIVRAVVAGTADASGGGEEVPVDVLVRVGPTNPVLTSKARPYRKLLAAWTDDGLVHIMQFPRSADVKTVARAAARARMAQTDDDGTPHTREQGSAASTSSAEASSSPSGSDNESGTPDARSGEYGFSPAVEPSSMSSPPTAAEMRIKSAGERFHGALDAICAELRVRTSVLQEVSSRGPLPIAHALQRCIQHMLLHYPVSVSVLPRLVQVIVYSQQHLAHVTLCTPSLHHHIHRTTPREKSHPRMQHWSSLPCRHRQLHGYHRHQSGPSRQCPRRRGRPPDGVALDPTSNSAISLLI